MARLTKEQRNLLDEVFKEHIDDYIGKTFTCNSLSNDLLAYMGDCGVISLSPQNITSSMQRISSDDYRIEKSYGVYKLRKIILSIRNHHAECVKDKNILIITNSFINKTGEYLSYDFITQKFNIDIDNCSRENVIGYDILVALKEVLKYEWLWNYTTDIDTLRDIYNSYFLKGRIKTMPKGYSKYLLETNQNMTYENLKEYIFSSLYGRFGWNICNEYQIPENKLEVIHNTIGLDIIKKIMISGAKNGEKINQVYDLITEISNLIDIMPKEKIINVLDTNRGVKKNREILKNILKNHKKDLLEKKLKSLNCINGLEIEDCIVVVPQTVEEKDDEGKQQNNCVGSYYDDSIIKGENLIYFVRRKEKPGKSYITCRYDTYRKDTVEYRYKNNLLVTRNDQEIINKITKIINERL